jgi:hypothetical protein
VIPWRRITFELKRYLVTQREAEEKRVKEIEENKMISNTKSEVTEETINEEAKSKTLIEGADNKETVRKQPLHFVFEKAYYSNIEIKVQSRIDGK